jgi:hypothetical protein
LAIVEPLDVIEGIGTLAALSLSDAEKLSTTALS